MQCPKCSTTVLAGEEECPFCLHPLKGQPTPLAQVQAQPAPETQAKAQLAEEKPVWKPTHLECPGCGSESFSTREVYLLRGNWRSLRLLQVSAAVGFPLVGILACVVLLGLSSGSASLVSVLAACAIGLRAILFYTSSLKSPRTTQYKCQNCGAKWEAETRVAPSRRNYWQV